MRQFYSDTLICFRCIQEKAKLEYETQKQSEEMTEAEAEQLAVQTRRAEGTPCTLENFMEWKAKYEEEIALEKEKEAQSALESKSKKQQEKEKKVVDKSGRLTGFLQFSDKVGTFNLEAMEAAAENAQADEDEEVEVENEELFDVDDDDLDDLDFDDDDEEPDI